MLLVICGNLWRHRFEIFPFVSLLSPTFLNLVFPCRNLVKSGKEEIYTMEDWGVLNYVCNDYEQ